MKKLLALLLFSSSLMAGEVVTVSWTPPSDFDSLPYSGYTIYYTDSTGADFTIPVDVTAVQHVVPNVEFGDSQWYMTSTCLCTTPESPPSSITPFVVKFKGSGMAPNTVSVTN